MKKLLAVEINGQCQLHCPHCYIDKKEWPKTLMLDPVIDSLPIEKYSMVSVVATEPFFNKESLRATLRLGQRVRSAGKQFAVISNALGLARAFEQEPELKDILSWIDISMDVPGKKGYSSYRGGSWSRFLKGVYAAKENNIEVSILNTVSSRTFSYFEEMIATSEDLATHFFTVSLMLSAKSRETDYGTNPLSSIKHFLGMCASSPAFKNSKKVKLDVGQTICEQSSESMKELLLQAKNLGIDDKVVFISHNPDNVIDRVTVSGCFILPSQTLEAAQY